MQTALDCLPCFVRQALETARLCSSDPREHERLVRDSLVFLATLDGSLAPPVLAQQLHRRLRQLSGNDDPYREAKARFDRLAAELLPRYATWVREAPDPLLSAVRLAVAGNVIDLGAKGGLTELDARVAIESAFWAPLRGDFESFCQAATRAERILYLADNAGEIAFDRLLIERLPAGRVTVAVRGAAVINDATLADAQAVGLPDVAEVIENGSDAPGTVLDDCSDLFRERFRESDVIISKGQGNYETLCDVGRDIFFLFRVKCPVVAARVGFAVGEHVLARTCSAAECSAEGART
jgi:damage-control phosphatase, subfamily I